MGDGFGLAGDDLETPLSRGCHVLGIQPKITRQMTSAFVEAFSNSSLDRRFVDRYECLLHARCRVQVLSK